MNRTDEDILIAAIARAQDQRIRAFYEAVSNKQARRIRPTFMNVLLDLSLAPRIPPHSVDQPHPPRPAVNSTIIPKSKRRRR